MTLSPVTAGILFSTGGIILMVAQVMTMDALIYIKSVRVGIDADFGSDTRIFKDFEYAADL
jgi:hypothetical protein